MKTIPLGSPTQDHFAWSTCLKFRSMINTKAADFPKESFLGSSDSKESPCKAGEPGFIPGSGRCPGEGNGYPLQYPCLENPMDRRAWQAPVHGGHKELDMTE